jgi:hypothetical protein
MFDRWEQTVPAGTSEEERLRVECKISPGLLTDLVVYFPPGCHRLVRSRVFLGEKPVAPRSAKGWLAADGYAVELHRIYELISENRPVLLWELWAPDTEWPHTLWMSAEWISAEVPAEERAVALLEDLSSAARRMGLIK